MPNKYHRQNFDKGGGADTGRIGEIKSKLAVATDKFKKMEPGGRMSKSDLERILKMMESKKKEMIPLAKGGRAGLKRGGGKFPDYSGDGKITMRDILMGRGVIPKKKKKKMIAKKFKSPMEKSIKGKKA